MIMRYGACTIFFRVGLCTLYCVVFLSLILAPMLLHGEEIRLGKIATRLSSEACVVVVYQIIVFILKGF